MCFKNALNRKANKQLWVLKYLIRFDTLYLSNCITKSSCVGKLAIIDLDTIFTLVERDWHVCWHKYEIN